MTLHRELTVLGDEILQICMVNTLKKLLKGSGFKVCQDQQHPFAGAQAHIGLSHGGFVAGKQHTAVLNPDIVDIQPAQLVTGQTLQSKQTGYGKFILIHSSSNGHCFCQLIIENG